MNVVIFNTVTFVIAQKWSTGKQRASLVWPIRMENVSLTGKPHLRYHTTLKYNVQKLGKYKVWENVGNKMSFLSVL